jgi:coenzyme F420-reducing hydrogenase delta subunit
MIFYVCDTKNTVVNNAAIETDRCKLEQINAEERKLFTSLINAIMNTIRYVPMLSARGDSDIYT